MADWGEVAGAFVLGGLAGGADKYTKLQDEQRKYQEQQALKEAEFTRSKALAEFGVELKTASTVVGQRPDGSLVTNSMVEDGAIKPGEYSTERDMKLEDAKSGQFLNGRELTNREVKMLSPEQQAQLKTADQHTLDMHEAVKRIDQKYKEPKQDTVGNAMELYKRKDAYDSAKLKEAFDKGEISEEEYAQLKKRDLGLTGQGDAGKVLKGVEKLRGKLEELDTSGLDEWEATTEQSKVFIRYYDHLNEKEKAQADKIYPGAAEQAVVVTGVNRLAELATAEGDKELVMNKFFDEFKRKNGIDKLPKDDPRVKKAATQVDEIARMFDDVYQKNVEEAPLWKPFTPDKTSYERK